jgi:carboxymethylenebutenolidase
MGQFIHLKSPDGFSLPVYVAHPAPPAKAAVVVIQEIFGVNAHIQAVTDRFAAQGYLALAPAMFERVTPAVNLGYESADMTAGMALKAAATALPDKGVLQGVLQDIQTTIDYAAAQTGGKVGITGFCWGGLLTWQAACTLSGITAAVPYYGGGMTAPEEIARQPKCPVMAHFAELDHYIPMDGVHAFAAARREVTVHTYPADHGFNCDQRGAYNAAAATLARGRTLAFFAEHLA